MNIMQNSPGINLPGANNAKSRTAPRVSGRAARGARFRGPHRSSAVYRLGGQRANVERQRTWVRNHYDAGARHHYQTVGGKLRLLDTIVRSDWIEPNETWKLQSLGITFGDALAQEMGLSWVTVEDEYGRDPALRDHDTTIVVFPMTTISKRIERGEAVDVQDLFDEACRTIIRLRGELKGA